MSDLLKVELAIRTVARRYAANGDHDSDLIADAFDRLAAEIRYIIQENIGDE